MDLSKPVKQLWFTGHAVKGKPTADKLFINVIFEDGSKLKCKVCSCNYYENSEGLSEDLVPSKKP